MTARVATSNRAKLIPGLAVLLAFSLAACGSSDSGAEATDTATETATETAAASASAQAAEAAGETPVLGFVTQTSADPYFVAVAEGAKKRAEELGVELIVGDTGRDAAETLSTTQTILTAGVQGIAVEPNTTDIGPRLFKMVNEAGVPLISNGTPVIDTDGTQAPHVGLPDAEAGAEVGTLLAEQFKARGWDPADTIYANVEASSVPVCMLRTNAAVEAFLAAVPDFPAENVIKVPYDGSTGKATDSARAVLTANPDAKYWLATSCNDNGVVGLAKAVQGNGGSSDTVIGIGLGGNLACQVYTDEFLSVAMPQSTYLDAQKIGATVIDKLYKLAVEKQEVPEFTPDPTVVISAGDYSQSVTCTE